MLVRQLSRPLFRPLFSSLSGIITKVFINLEAAANAYYSLSAPVVFAGDFEIVVDIVTTTSGYEQHIVDSSADLLCKVTIGSTGLVKFLVGDGSSWAVNIQGTTNLGDGILPTIKCSKVGAVYKIIVNGAEEATTTTANAVTPSIAQIGRRSNASGYFNGILSSLKLTDLTTPTNSVSFGLDNLVSNTEINNGVTLTYNNIATTTDVRDTYTLSNNGTQWISDLRTIDIAQPPPPAFENGVLTCSGVLGCSEIIPCGE